MLTRTRAALQRHGETTLPALAAELACDRERVEAALEYWIQRGNVRADELTDAACAPTSCGGCPLVARCAPRSHDAATSGSVPPARRRASVSYRWVTG